jgi:uncharacterized protein (UPF0210 family)
MVAAGFNGMMLPVLEDSILAKRAAEGWLTVKDLLFILRYAAPGWTQFPFLEIPRLMK